MKKNYFLIMIVLGFLSCKKKNPNPVEGPAEVDVYVAGKEYNGSIAIAKYWKNGQAIALTDGTKTAYANSIVVGGSDVYVAGDESNRYNGMGIAKYWKNGKAMELTDGTNISEAWSILLAKK